MPRDVLTSIAANTPVTSYADYRDYLAELYRQVKAAVRPYSYLLFAADLGFAATNVLRLVIARQRTLTPKSARTIARVLGLAGDNRRYFLALVAFAHARGVQHRQRCFREVLAAKQAGQLPSGDQQRMAYFDDAMHTVLREMARLQQFHDDPAWVAEALYHGISPERAAKSLDLLTELGLLQRDGATGKRKVADAAPLHLPADATAGHLAVAQYHQTMLDLAKAALVEVPTARREFNALTVSLSPERFKQLRAMVRDFCAAAMAIDTEEQVRTLAVQINLQMFTLNKPFKTGA